jgi:hypothetical protein
VRPAAAPIQLCKLEIHTINDATAKRVNTAEKRLPRTFTPLAASADPRKHSIVISVVHLTLDGVNGK